MIKHREHTSDKPSGRSGISIAGSLVDLAGGKSLMFSRSKRVKIGGFHADAKSLANDWRTVVKGDFEYWSGK